MNEQSFTKLRAGFCQARPKGFFGAWQGKGKGIFCPSRGMHEKALCRGKRPENFLFPPCAKRAMMPRTGGRMFNTRTLFLSTLVCGSLLGLPALAHAEEASRPVGIQAGADARESVTQQSVVVVPEEPAAAYEDVADAAGVDARDLEDEAAKTRSASDEGTVILRAGGESAAPAADAAVQGESVPVGPATLGEGAAENASAAAPANAAEAASAAPAAEEDKKDDFVPSIALVRRLAHETELPAMQISLGLVDFVGEVEGAYPGEDSFAILPLRRDAVIEVYELNYDGRELSQREGPSVVRELANHEAYVFRVPYVAGMPTREVCVRTNGVRHCWRPGSGELGQGFLYWQKTKGMD